MRSIPLPPEFAWRTVPSLLAARTARTPYARAVVGRSGNGSYRALTYQELDEAAGRVAGGLATAGVRRGDRVGWILDNGSGVDALIIYHAVLRLGAVNVPVNARLAPPEVAHILRHSGARMVLVGPDHKDRARDAPCDVVVLNTTDPLGPLRGAPVPAVAGLADTDPANLLYTSGTTGRPKGVLHTHGSSLAAAIGWSDAFRLTPNDVLQSPFPVTSGAGLHFNALSCLSAGACVVVDDYDTAASLALIAEVGATVYVAVPSIYAFWLDSPLIAEASLETLRILDYGGASMPASLIQQLRAAVPSAGLMHTYGLTEAGPGGCYLPEEYALARLGSIGNRWAGRFTQVRVVDEHGADVGPGGTGELLLRGPSIMVGYYGDQEATAAAFLDGWLRSGDVVRVDDEGFLYHVDRRKDIIVRGGHNVAGAEVEAALHAHPAVREAAVIGVPHPRLGEDVYAVVVLRESLDGSLPAPADLIAHCRELLADFKCPRRVEVVEALPRNAAGKVLKQVLRERVRQSGTAGSAKP
ncbi:long-chain fatty acid--CoA ligase [Dactylosporangium fulvum]|uniref:AMP-binding protein n=1 Tax=Dactylosporangium fulvum TaxID=53359 RepID=A0ABY5W981_9ACTN|nr:AMP-binding protein [Dactylosporangium fulvum]UWP85636.1 AMP-binding protein [Dactylosporangium fulvum]